MSNLKLTKMQEGFANDIGSGKYDFDYQAYEANYSCKNMSKNSIYVETCKLLQNPKISQRIKELRDQAIKRSHVTVDEVLNELANWIRFDPLSIIDPETEALLPLKDMDKKARMSLGEIHIQELYDFIPNESGKGKAKVKVGELKKIKFIDKRAVGEMFMKKFGQYIDPKSQGVDSLDVIREVIAAMKKD